MAYRICVSTLRVSLNLSLCSFRHHGAFFFFFPPGEPACCLKCPSSNWKKSREKSRWSVLRVQKMNKELRMFLTNKSHVLEFVLLLPSCQKRRSGPTRVFQQEISEMLNIIHWEDALAEVSVTFKQQGSCSPDDDSSVVEQPVAWFRMNSLFQKNNTITGNFPSEWKLSCQADKKKFPSACLCPWHPHKMMPSSALNTTALSPLCHH